MKAVVIGLSLSLASAWVALLVRSYWWSDVVGFSSPSGDSYLVTCAGGVYLYTQPYVTPPSWGWLDFETGNPPERYRAGFGPGRSLGLGVRYGSYFTSMAHNAWVVAVPLWLFAAASFVPVPVVLFAGSLWRLIVKRRGRGFPVVMNTAGA